MLYIRHKTNHNGIGFSIKSISGNYYRNIQLLLHPKSKTKKQLIATSTMANTGAEWTQRQVPEAILLPGDCLIRLDSFGLPASPEIEHSKYRICCCLGQRDVIYVYYLVMWQSKYSIDLQIDQLKATAMVCHLIDEWQLQVPLWLQPIVTKWVEELENGPVVREEEEQLIWQA